MVAPSTNPNRTAAMTEPNALDARAEALEMRVAFQERTIEDLNEAIARQWKEIDALGRKVARLEEQIQDLRASAAAPGESEPPPPHY